MGDKVIATITDYGSKNKNPEGKIKENLGNIRTPGTDILAIVKSFGIPSEFRRKYRSRHREFRITYWMLTEMEDWT